MRCANCGFQNRPGVKYCEQCGLKLPEKEPVSKRCTFCGFYNRMGVKFCERCGNPLDESEKGAVLPIKRRKIPKFLKVVGWIGIVLLILLLGLIFLGMLPSRSQPAPVVSADPIPLLTLKGTSASGEAVSVEPGSFSASATDPEGIGRMELYVDGELTAAENYPGEPNAPAVFDPPLETLPEGGHEIMVVTTNTRGQTAHSQVVPIINEEPIPLPPEEGLVIEPDPYNLPAPEVIIATLSADLKTVKVGWSLPAVPFKHTNIYLQRPGAAGPTLQAVAGTAVSEYDFPADPSGLWHIYISFVSLDGREGPLGHVHIVVPEAAAAEELADPNSKIASANISLELLTENLQNGIYAYVRIGGPANRYQRFPPGQGEFFSRQVAGKLFNFELPFNNWPISQPLLVEVSLWALDGQGNPWRVGWYSHTFTPEEMARGHIEFQSNEFSAQIDLDFEQEKFGYISTDTAGGPRPVLLPPPTHTQIASFFDQCQFVASTLGPVRDALYPQCVEAVNDPRRQFLLWDWPLKEPGALAATEADITGFELKVQVTDIQNQLLGENITPIPFPKARGTLRNTQPVDCGLRLTWYIRAVSPDAVSEWAYAGTIPPAACGAPEPEVDGCRGQISILEYIPLVGQAVPDLLFESACNDHDRCYNRPWSGKDKVTCDNEFLGNLLKLCYSGPANLLNTYDPLACPAVAQGFYTAVNLFGRFIYKYDMDVRDCWRAYNRQDCLLGHSPEFLSNAWSAIKAGGAWTGKAILTGGEKLIDFGEWGGRKIGNGVKKGLELFGL